ncbi:MAG: PD40 domain-containing protein [Candidatus Eremiobacteraeota bacterium]|nr:PD40 domain-containing protein [Candidatus Eremiobacteraeota bacterium]
MRKFVWALALLFIGCGESNDEFLGGNPAGPSGSPTTQLSRIVQPPSGLITTRWVTNDPQFNDYRPTFSPDDGTIVFERNTVGNAQVRLHKVNSSGGTVSFLLSGFGQNSTRPDWSVATNRIAFTAENSAGGTLWVCNPDGSNVFQVTNSAFSKQVDYPHWFPDGISVAATDYGNGGLTASKGIVRKVNVDQKSSTNLTDPSVLLAGDSSVSPDGRWLVLAAQADVNAPYNQDTNNIFVIDLQATKNTAPILFDGGQGRAPAWSPDGSVILFESNRASASGQYAIFAKRFSGQASDLGGSLLQLTPDALDGQHAEFSHGGTRVVLTALQSSSSGSPRGILMLELASALQNL